MRGPAETANDIRAQIPVMLAELSKPRTLEEVTAAVKEQSRAYTESLQAKITTLTEERDAALAEVDRLTRNVRVIGGTARNYGEDYPKLGVFVDLAQRSAVGERL